MSKFVIGDKVWWEDPAGDCSRWDTVTAVNEDPDGEEPTLYTIGEGTEVYEHELYKTTDKRHDLEEQE